MVRESYGSSRFDSLGTSTPISIVAAPVCVSLPPALCKGLGEILINLHTYNDIC